MWCPLVGWLGSSHPRLPRRLPRVLRGDLQRLHNARNNRLACHEPDGHPQLLHLGMFHAALHEVNAAIGLSLFLACRSHLWTGHGNK